MVCTNEIGAELVGTNHQHIGPGGGSGSGVASTGSFRSARTGDSHSARSQGSVTQKVAPGGRGW